MGDHIKYGALNAASAIGFFVQKYSRE